MAQSDTPPPPMPSQELAQVLSWLLKMSGMQPLKKCEAKWGRRGFNIEESILALDASVIRIGISRGEKVVRLMNWSWATRWVVYYGIPLIPHHRQMQKLQE